ncbi:MAG: hypothetical protein IIY28_06625, partial [Lachnospiraceae bacterium]|nr:hypothetical protein [Lachnospiraceae bacterium]
EKQALQPMPACGIGKFGKQHAGEAVAAARAGMRNREIRQTACRRSSRSSPCRHAESGNSASSMPEKQVLQALPACGIGKFGKQHAGEASAASPAGMWNRKIRQAACRESRHRSPYRHVELGNSANSMPENSFRGKSG